MKKFCAIFLAALLLLTSACGYTRDDLEEARQAGYDDGYEDGYDDGVSDAEAEEYDTAVDVGYGLGYSDGYDSGYDDGYDDGYDAGTAPGAYNGSSSYVYETPAVEESEAMVYVSRTGTKYHSNPNCSNMKNPGYVSISDAIAQGRTACSKCY